jgi:hypothetical protein
VIVLPSQHLSNIIYYKSLMRNPKEKHSVGSFVQGRYCRMVIFICLDRFDKALCYYLAVYIYTSSRTTYVGKNNTAEAVCDKEEWPLSLL